jgi:hypothetical protein
MKRAGGGETFRFPLANPVPWCFYSRPSIAGVAQLVEHFLAKEDVASSSLVTRSMSHPQRDL